jgi:predicted acyltransferase
VTSPDPTFSSDDKLTRVSGAGASVSTPERLVALDVFRGATMAAMVIVNNPGDWSHVYAPLLHAEWHGCTPTDLIFPFFLFIVGVSITLSRKHGRLPAIVVRALKLVGLGLLLAAIPYFNFERLRYPGVLQRIGLCYFVAAVAWQWAGHSTGAERARTVLVRIGGLAALMLVGYWVILLAVPGESGARYDLSPEGNVGAMLDRAIMSGHLWKPRWDPEGLLSTLPAIGTTLIGVLAGYWLGQRRSVSARAAGLVLGGAAFTLLGLAWSTVFPLNKPIWTSSYAIFTAGLGAVALGASLWIIDARGWRGWTHPFVVLGMNAIALFVLSALLAKTLAFIKVPRGETLVSLKAVIYQAAFVPLASPKIASLLFAAANLVVLYFVLLVMYRRRIFLKV